MGIMPQLFDPTPFETSDGYQSYLKSRWWQERRAAMLRIHPACMLDGYPHQLEVHHVRYTHLGGEPDDDLIVLCWRCHRRHHGTTKSAA